MVELDRMYEGAKSWSPFVGCKFHCVYCEPSFQRQAKRRRKWCELCYRYEPHFHPERLSRVPSAKLIFTCAFGDIAFARSHEVEQILRAVEKYKNKTFMFQTKDPACYVLYLNYPHAGGESIVPENAILGTTIETTYDDEYERISQAPPPSERYEIMADDVDHRKFVTIEPILDLDIDIMVGWIKDIEPEFVYVGYDTHNCKLPEPGLRKTKELIERLEKVTEVRPKTIRAAWWEEE